MGKIVSVDIKHELGAEEAKRRFQDGIDAMKHKYADKLSALTVEWTDLHADLKFTIIGHSLTAALDFLPNVVRVSLELPWILAMAADKAKSMIARNGSEMLKLPPPPKA
jgi:hypothetical protein